MKSKSIFNRAFEGFLVNIFFRELKIEIAFNLSNNEK